MRTKEEIEEQIKKGKEFVKEHPCSIFGDDNVANFGFFKRIIERFKKDKDLDALEEFVEDAYDGDDLTFALDVVGWLRGDTDEDFW